MRVKAIKPGQYNGILKQTGEEFEMTPEDFKTMGPTEHTHAVTKATFIGGWVRDVLEKNRLDGEGNPLIQV